MSEVISPTATTKQRAGVKKAVRRQARIDMTPMVDLGFLLISFFVITTELSKPTAMNLIMPADGPPMDLGESDAMTVIPAENDNVWYYFGRWTEAERTGNVHKTTVGGKEGLRQLIIRRQQQLDANPASKEKRNGFMILIKPMPKSSYKNLVYILDEIAITEVKKHALVKLTDEEKSWVDKQQE